LEVIILRIIAGDAKGRKIAAPPGMDTRPTSDKVKGALFNILGSKVLGARVLDLFGGAGNLGLEAISRGAEQCIFVDNSLCSVKIIHQNINTLGYEKFCEVYRRDAFSALDILEKRGAKFDIIFLDPPYHRDMVPMAIKKISQCRILEDNGVIVAEHDAKDFIPEQILDLILVKTYFYGSTGISLYKRIEE